MSDYPASGPYGPTNKRSHHRERRFLEMTVAGAVVACVAAAVLIAAVRFRPPQFTVCHHESGFTACVTAPQPPAVPVSSQSIWRKL